MAQAVSHWCVTKGCPSIPGHSMWELWGTKWHWGKVYWYFHFHTTHSLWSFIVCPCYCLLSGQIIHDHKECVVCVWKYQYTLWMLHQWEWTIWRHWGRFSSVYLSFWCHYNSTSAPCSFICLSSALYIIKIWEHE